MNTPALSEYSRVWSAVETHARETHRSEPLSVLVMYADGSIAEVKAGGRVEEGWGDTPGEFPAPSGWSFRVGEAAFNGRPFRVGGLRGRLLRALVEGHGEPVRDGVLKGRVWADLGIEDRRLKDVVYQLRALLRASLDLVDGADPIERVEGGYRLAMGDSV